MQTVLLFFGASLLLFGCESGRAVTVPASDPAAVPNYRDTIAETDSTFEIGRACAVYFPPSHEQIEALKAEVGEEDFYTIADDYAWYQAESGAFLEEKGLRVLYADKKTARFHLLNSAVNAYSPSDTSVTWKILLYDGKNTIVKTSAIDVEEAYKNGDFSE